MTVRITDTTMRDGHQSLLATRMRTRPVILSGHHILVQRGIFAKESGARQPHLVQGAARR